MSCSKKEEKEDDDDTLSTSTDEKQTMSKLGLMDSAETTEVQVFQSEPQLDTATAPSGSQRTIASRADESIRTTTTGSCLSLSTSVVRSSQVPPLLSQQRHLETIPGAFRQGGNGELSDQDVDDSFTDDGAAIAVPPLLSLQHSPYFIPDETIISAVLVQEDDEVPTSNRSRTCREPSTSHFEPLDATMLVQAEILDERKRWVKQVGGVACSLFVIIIFCLGAFLFVTLFVGTPVLTFESSRSSSLPWRPTAAPTNKETLPNDDGIMEGLEETGSEEKTHEPTLAPTEVTGDPMELPLNETEVLPDEDPTAVPDKDGQSGEDGLVPTASQYSYHVLNWGAGTFCNNFEGGNITLSCGGQGVIDEWEIVKGHCENVDGQLLQCQHEDPDWTGNSTVIFSCMGTVEEDLVATAHQSSSHMSDCKIWAGSSILYPLLAGVSTTYLSLGRYCQEDRYAATKKLILNNNYECQNGETKSIFVKDRKAYELSVHDYTTVEAGVDDRRWQGFCYNEAECESFAALGCNAVLPEYYVQDDEPNALCSFKNDGALPAFADLKMLAQEQMFMGDIFLYDFWYWKDPGWI